MGEYPRKAIIARRKTKSKAFAGRHQNITMNNLKEELQKEIQRLYSEEGIKGTDNWGKVRNAGQFERKVREYNFGQRTCFEKKDEQAYADLQASRGLSLDPKKSIEENLEWVDKDSDKLPPNDIARIQELMELLDFDKLENFIELGFRSPRLLKSYKQYFKNCIGYDIVKANVLTSQCLGYDCEVHDLSSDEPIDLKQKSIVAAYHVFEHLPDPLQTLNKIYKSLCPDSYFHIEIPLEKVDDPVVRYAHCTSFRLGDLELMLKDVGFSVVFNAIGVNTQRILAKK